MIYKLPRALGELVIVLVDHLLPLTPPPVDYFSKRQQATVVAFVHVVFIDDDNFVRIS